MAKRNRNKYWNDYTRKNYVRVQIVIRKDDDEILNRLDSVDSKSGYIVDLIRKDIKASE